MDGVMSVCLSVCLSVCVCLVYTGPGRPVQPVCQKHSGHLWGEAHQVLEALRELPHCKEGHLWQSWYVCMYVCTLVCQCDIGVYVSVTLECLSG